MKRIKFFLFILFFIILPTKNMDNQESNITYEQLSILPESTQIAYLQLLSDNELKNLLNLNEEQNEEAKVKKKVEEQNENKFEVVNNLEKFIRFEKIRREKAETAKLEKGPDNITRIHTIEKNDIRSFLCYFQSIPTMSEKVVFLQKWKLDEQVQLPKDIRDFMNYPGNKIINESDCQEIETLREINSCKEEQYELHLIEEKPEEEIENDCSLENKIKKGLLQHNNPYIQTYLTCIKKKQSEDQKAACLKKEITFLQEELDQLDKFCNEALENLFWNEYIEWKNSNINKKSNLSQKEVSKLVTSWIESTVKKIIGNEDACKKFGNKLWGIYSEKEQIEFKEEPEEETQKIQLTEEFQLIEETMQEKFEELEVKKQITEFESYKNNFKIKYNQKIQECEKKIDQLYQKYKNLKEKKIKKEEEKQAKEEEIKKIEDDKNEFLEGKNIVEWEILSYVNTVNRLLHQQETKLEERDIEAIKTLCNLVFLELFQQAVEAEENEKKESSSNAEEYSDGNRDETWNLFKTKCLVEESWTEEKKNKAKKYLSHYLPIINYSKSKIADELLKMLIHTNSFLNNDTIKNIVYNLLFFQLKLLPNLCKNKNISLKTYIYSNNNFITNFKKLSSDEKKEFLEFIKNYFVQLNPIFKHVYLFPSCIKGICYNFDDIKFFESDLDQLNNLENQYKKNKKDWNSAVEQCFYFAFQYLSSENQITLFSTIANQTIKDIGKKCFQNFADKKFNNITKCNLQNNPQNIQKYTFIKIDDFKKLYDENIMSIFASKEYIENLILNLLKKCFEYAQNNKLDEKYFEDLKKSLEPRLDLTKKVDDTKAPKTKRDLFCNVIHAIINHNQFTYFSDTRQSPSSDQIISIAVEKLLESKDLSLSTDIQDKLKRIIHYNIQKDIKFIQKKIEDKKTKKLEPEEYSSVTIGKANNEYNKEETEIRELNNCQEKLKEIAKKYKIDLESEKEKQEEEKSESFSDLNEEDINNLETVPGKNDEENKEELEKVPCPNDICFQFEIYTKEDEILNNLEKYKNMITKRHLNKFLLCLSIAGLGLCSPLIADACIPSLEKNCIVSWIEQKIPGIRDFAKEYQTSLAIISMILILNNIYNIYRNYRHNKNVDCLEEAKEPFQQDTGNQEQCTQYPLWKNLIEQYPEQPRAENTTEKSTLSSNNQNNLFDIYNFIHTELANMLREQHYQRKTDHALQVVFKRKNNNIDFHTLATHLHSILKEKNSYSGLQLEEAKG